MSRFLTVALLALIPTMACAQAPAPLVINVVYNAGPGQKTLGSCPGALVNISIGGVAQNNGQPFVADNLGNVTVPFTALQLASPIAVTSAGWASKTQLYAGIANWASYNTIVQNNGIPNVALYLTPYNPIGNNVRTTGGASMPIIRRRIP